MVSIIIIKFGIKYIFIIYLFYVISNNFKVYIWSNSSKNICKIVFFSRTEVDLF
jgi:hypothetical protein